MVKKTMDKPRKPTIKSNKVKKASKRPVIKRDTVEIDATDKVVGRLSTQIVTLLRGKNKPTFQPYLDEGENVIVNNASKIRFTGKKLEQKVYYHHSGYPGGLREKKMGEVFEKNPGEVLKKAVWNMLPKNKLRSEMIKRLTIKN